MAVSSGASRLYPLTPDQAAASAPDRHVWLSASAGTGKTQVLSARVYRLLLSGTDPGAILCLTFTKAGAAEMADRISATLARWVRAEPEELAADLKALGEDFGPEAKARARTLFARVLDAPGGGLRIQTIHGFCQSLLTAFPAEAGLVPGFRPLEAREEAVLAREALAAMLVEAERETRRWLVDAVGALSLRLGEGKAEQFLMRCARAGKALDALPPAIQPWLRDAMGLPQGDIDAAIEATCDDAAFDRRALERIAAANRAWATATGIKAADLCGDWLAAPPAERRAQLGALKSLFLTQKGEPKKAAAKLVAADPDYEALALALGERCTALLAMQDAGAFCDLLARALDAGREYALAFAAAKRRVGAVDFDDLIAKTIALLRQPDIAEWVRFKLDQSVDHILIDEAQDTNPDQWAIVGAMAEEFFTGAGARPGVTRTLFSVGDYKQAIFGFQGTDPLYFRAAHRFFDEKAGTDARKRPRLGVHSLVASFRSTRPVLQFVDKAIAALPSPGMGELSDPQPHASEVPGPGTVELWPIVDPQAEQDDGEEQWVSDTVRTHATRIARTIKDWIGTLPLESKGRMLEPGDVMILVKRRGELAALLVARLYAEGVRVAGVDRLRLNAPLAVQDLLAAIRFALQPDDDLSLASLLVSPLIGWTQDELMQAALRGRGALWRHLRETQPVDRLAPLNDILARADFDTPYRFLEHILSGPIDGRRKLLRRLGDEARDPIEELLTAALGFEGLATPSLQRFIDWFDRGDVEIVRDAAQPQGAVRVLTAHGAKGLQAPLVILADATTDPGRSPRDFLNWTIGDATLPVFRPRTNERFGPLAARISAADQAELEEHWRLFYVAATRAEERLVITGALSERAKGEVPANSWYAVADAAMTALGVASEPGATRVWRGDAVIPAVKAKPRAKAALPDPVEAPGWLHAPAPVEARPPRPLAPSSIGDDAVIDPPPDPAMRAAAERGRLLHALFERLPAIAPPARAGAAERWLEQSAGVADAGERAELVAAALRVLNEPDFADLFGPDALAEAPIAAVVDGGVVMGTVDRLLVTETHVQVIDFKTARRAPEAIDAIPDYHVRQMAAYAAALEIVFPGRSIAAGLLYTAGPVLHWLPDALLARNKPGYRNEEQSLGTSAP